MNPKVSVNFNDLHDYLAMRRNYCTDPDDYYSMYFESWLNGRAACFACTWMRDLSMELVIVPGNPGDRDDIIEQLSDSHWRVVHAKVEWYQS